ncbi:MAG: amidohydrolase family protein [Bacteroidales bacterium]|nr:amidohydrolase family protein [Candidatus Cacconaster caballi]
MRRFLFICLALSLMLTSCNKADRVFVNAKVYSISLDDKVTHAEAVAVSDGKIVYVGDEAGVQKYIGKNTQVTDCGGNTLMPAFNDGHMHFSVAVRRFGVADLNFTPEQGTTPAEVVKEIQRRVKEFADAHPQDPVVHGSGWDRAWFFGGADGPAYKFTRHDIDAVVSDRPVVLESYCGHAAMFNTKALELAGVLSADTPEPKAGVLRRGADGIPDGYVQEPVLMAPLCAAIPNFNFTDRQNIDGMLAAQDMFLTKGYALVTDCMKTEGAYEAMKKIAEDGSLKMRTSATFLIMDATREEDMQFAIDHRNDFNVGDILTINTVKYFVDGMPAPLEPFTSEYLKENGLPEDYVEPLLWNEENLAQSFKQAVEAGFNIHIHTMGDRAQRVVVSDLIEAQKLDPQHKLRNVIAHNMLVDPADIKLMGENGIIANVQPLWMNYNIVNDAGMEHIFGPERHKRFYPFKSFIDAGVVCANGTDFSVNLPDPFAAIQIAMTRKVVPTDKAWYDRCKDIPAMNPAECVSLNDIVKALTVNVAYQLHMEDLTGSVEVGKSAEIIILDGDLESTPIEEICKLNVVETIIKGKTEYKATSVTKITDYLYEYEADGYGTEAPTSIITDDGRVAWACSAVRNGNFYGRNLDLGISENCEFVIRTKATAERKHASIGVANTSLSTITNETVEAGLGEDLLNYIPWLTMDGVNDAGLVCNINVVNMSDIDLNRHTHTNPGKPQIMVMYLVRALLDNCGSVAEAKEFIAAHDITQMPEDVAAGWDGHIMIADKESTVVVEFTGEEGSEVKYVDTEIMTNFYNHQYAAEGVFPPHGCGVERYRILKDNYDTSGSMEGMWELLKKVQYTQSYTESTEPFWCSEHIDAVEGGDITWTKEQLLAEEKIQKIMEAYKVYEQTGRYDPADGMWFTAHNSTYDIAGRTLWVTIREKYDTHYEFKL